MRHNEEPHNETLPTVYYKLKRRRAQQMIKNILINFIKLPLILILLLTVNGVAVNSIYASDNNQTRTINSQVENLNKTKNLIIVVSTKPIYNLTAAILKDAASPILLIKGNGSPHTYSLKPSDIKLINSADILIWGGQNIEPFLAKLIATKVKIPLIIDITNAKDLLKLPIRSNNIFKTTAMRNDAHTGHTHDHDAEDTSTHAFCAHGQPTEDKDETQALSNSGTISTTNQNKKNTMQYFDSHVWLSPSNAIAIVDHIGQQIGSKYPSFRQEIKENTKDFKDKLLVTNKNIKTKLEALHGKGYLVFHDAYQYFERYYKLNNLGVISVDPQVTISAKKLRGLEQCIVENKVTCIFSEPQFNPKLINILHKQTGVNKGQLDPLGRDKDLGTDGYFKLLENLTNDLSACLLQN